jgi:hypothetical protein
MGNVSAIAIPVDFSFTRGQDPEIASIRKTLNTVEQYFRVQSEERFNLSIDLHPEWIDSNFELNSLGLTSAKPDYKKILTCANRCHKPLD